MPIFYNVRSVTCQSLFSIFKLVRSIVLNLALVSSGGRRRRVRAGSRGAARRSFVSARRAFAHRSRERSPAVRRKRSLGRSPPGLTGGGQAAGWARGVPEFSCISSCNVGRPADDLGDGVFVIICCMPGCSGYGEVVEAAHQSVSVVPSVSTSLISTFSCGPGSRSCLEGSWYSGHHHRILKVGTAAGKMPFVLWGGASRA